MSRPDLRPPRISIRTAEPGLDPGYVFLMVRFSEREKGDPQAYAVVVDRAGELVWTRRFGDDGTFPNDLSVQTYRGEPVITYWRGSSSERGWADGEYVLLDSRYREIATVSAGNGYHADFHDLEITPRGTAYVLSYPTVRGNPEVREGVIQEVDIATGRVLFEWHSIDHVGLEESAAPAPKKDEAFDYFHVNSVDEGPDGDLLVSARHTKAIYRIDRPTGEVEWTMGGSHNDFDLGEGVEFGWQHDARWHPDGRISLLDNASNLDDQGPPSRALTLAVDEEAETAEIVSEYLSPDDLTSGSQANHQLLPSGNSVVGWGSRPAFTAFAPSGEILLHGTLPTDTFSYRARLAEWTGQPDVAPAAVVRDDKVYVSWNGATEVREWRLLTGDTEDTLTEASTSPRTGFETAIDLPDDAAYVAVEAVDDQGDPLGRSEVTSAAS
ncbi:MAG TPA: arylsulfotransferase family protein [Actinophytocola sp.]|nr:arylsulfotransferase family protein [Actinophytocola sp.]